MRTRTGFAKGASVALLIVVMAFAGVPSMAAHGDGADVVVTASIIGGERFISLTNSPVALLAVVGTNTYAGAMSLTVAELSRTGTNPWSVTGVMSTPMTKTTDPAVTIADSNMAIAPIDPVVQLLGGGACTVGTGGSLDSAQTIFTNDGQVTTTAYTGTYTANSTITLTVPNGTPTGDYSGVITLTLVQ